MESVSNARPGTGICCSGKSQMPWILRGQT
ncbi:hypothetical protein M271_26495 [Streptomyces rapamycinicus NRRL 5491]|nr:hypothetical protein M271_26495 [Streptomyces rapamycinicus NRRL 5491]